MMYAHARVVNLFKDGGYQGEIGVVPLLKQNTLQLIVKKINMPLS